jgi:hypothetical protein
LRLKNPSINKPKNQPVFFFGKPNSFRFFFLKFRKLNFILETDQFFGFCRFQQVPRSIIAGPGVIVAGGIGRCYRIRSVPSVKNMARSRCPAIRPFTPTTTAPRRRRCSCPQPASLPPRDGRSLDRHRRCTARLRPCPVPNLQAHYTSNPIDSPPGAFMYLLSQRKKKLKRECTVHTYAASKAA